MNTSRNLPDLSIKKIWGKLFKHDNDIEVLQERPVNNNILINSNFANPVNQRGGVSPLILDDSNNGRYWIDRWYIRASSLDAPIEWKLTEKGVDVTTSDSNVNGRITQLVEFPKNYLGKTVTFSICINGEIHKLTTTFPNTLEEGHYARSEDFDDYTALALGIHDRRDCIFAEVYINGVGTRTIQWVKLEVGEVATPYVPRFYAEELQLCKRYYQNLFVADAVLHSVNTGAIGFVKEYNVEMRIAPTCDVSNCKLFANAAAQSGFTVSVISVGRTSFTIIFSKSNHGLNYTNYLTTCYRILLDAEL